MLKPTTNAANLRRILQQEVALGKRLLALCEAQGEAVVRDDVPRLNQIAGEQQQCLQEQQQLEKARIGAVSDLTAALGLERVPPLSGLLPALPAPDQATLTSLRADLLSLHAKLVDVQTRNRRLIDNALDYAQFSLDLITQTTLQPARYGVNLAQISAPAFYIDSKA